MPSLTRQANEVLCSSNTLNFSFRARATIVLLSVSSVCFLWNSGQSTKSNYIYEKVNKLAGSQMHNFLT